MTDPLEGLRVFIAEVVKSELDKKPEQDDYLSTHDAAELADVAVGTIRRWVRAGKLRDHRAGRRVRVSRADLHRLLREGVPLNDSATPEQVARRKYG